ncbi:MAG: hypothetical protein A3J48_04695 [Candidatus Doudnabacteria bacterium RIFCSPHIGHO2_02_FULL_46_11]|uniref:inosine/xanthosine triphosphatase n=1 Tax=Candidatus Doudnabacteria bacterium RIFCSPHIGHO2_02_FULL_46_11 TaxID=1817832 RepID=A0A1F5P6I0_9BACT|nr:MAG: hypothetical protein A3J48_04695 [Candidatus Doudnabacteria bacterium RIFCSPHIGHO2_02_FULL_46_11]
MKIKVGSKNQTKLEAIVDTIKDYGLFKEAEVIPVAVQIEEFGHPKNLAEVVEGAKDRAEQAFVDCDYSFGIEGGLMAVPHTKTGFMETSVCAIYDGQNYYLGMSPSFEWPRKVVELILQGRDGSQAMREAGITDYPKIGTSLGAIHPLSNGRMNRKDYTKYAIIMALIHLEHPEHY